MDIIVTGGCGFVGSHVVEQLIEKGYKVGVIGFSCHLENLEDIKNEVKFVRADINDKEKVGSIIKDVEGVLHLAGLVNVDQSLSDPESFIRTNVIGTFNVMEAVRKNSIEKLLYMSTCEVYGNIPKGKADENHPTNPCSPYAASKFSAERYLLSYSYSYPEQNIVIVRGFNQYGPRQSAGTGGAVIPKFITKILSNQKIKVFGDGKQMRDYVFVKDTVRGIVSAFEKNLPTGEVINLGTGIETSIIDIANKLCEISGKNKEDYIEFVSSRPGELIRSCGDSSKAKNLLNWEPKVKFNDGLKTTFEFYEHKTKTK